MDGKHVPTELPALMSRYHIVVAVIVSIGTERKETLGDRRALDSDYTVRTVFDDLSVQEIEQYLDGRILPRMIQQGRVCGVICKPNEDTIVGLYYHDERDVVQRYEMSKSIDADIRELWSCHSENE